MTTAARFSDSRRSRNRGRRRISGARNLQRKRKTCFRPLIDPLEPRHLLTAVSALIVDNPIDGELGSLRQVIEVANATEGHDNIQFDLDVDTIAVEGQIVITDDVTIHGPGEDALNIVGVMDRVFAIVPAAYADAAAEDELDDVDLFTPPTVAQLSETPEVGISRLTISGGVAKNAPGLPLASGFSFGGGIYNLGSELNLDHVTMIGNTAAGGVTAAGEPVADGGAITAGGAIANEFGGVLNVHHSTFVGNLSSGIAVAVGGAITSDLGRVNDGTEEGAQTRQPVVHISHSEFIENTAQVLVLGNTGEPFVGLGGGGALLSVTGVMTVKSSHFEGNSALGGPASALPDTPLVSGGAGLGGAILTGNISPFGFDQSSLEVQRSTFVGNVAQGGDSSVATVPGGVGGGGAISAGNGTIADLSRNVFRTNQSLGGTGGNDAPGGIGTGGGVAVAGGSELTSQRNRFVENLASGGQGSGEGPAATGRGGALAIDALDLPAFLPGPGNGSSRNDTFHGNTAVGGIGGGIYNEGSLQLTGSRLTDNLAQGETDTIIDFVPGYLFGATALGGGISNLGELEMSRVTLRGNQAIGADAATGPLAIATGVSTYPGLAVGGGLHNIESATVQRSSFIDNEALGGNGNFGSFAGVANGGGIYSDGTLDISRSTVRGNQSIGGANNLGDINAGGGYGGGLTSGSVTPLNIDPNTGQPIAPVRSADLTMNQVTVIGNEAVGGDGNGALDLGLPFPLPNGHLPAGGVGGGIVVYQGEAELNRVTVTNNLAAGGEGGLGVGGGVSIFGFVANVSADMSRVLAIGNRAEGGEGRDGFGGGIALGGLASLFSTPGVLDPVEVEMSRTIALRNVAEGGEDADGLGGGLFIGDDTIADVARSLFLRNRAIGGSDGDGFGGGVYNLSDLAEIDALIFGNFASTDDDDCFGC